MWLKEEQVELPLSVAVMHIEVDKTKVEIIGEHKAPIANDALRSNGSIGNSQLSLPRNEMGGK